MKVLAALVFCVAFGVAWRYAAPQDQTKAAQEKPPVARSEGDGAAGPGGSSDSSLGARVVTRGLANLLASRRDPADLDAIRKSNLPEWGRFRHEHPYVAAAAEMAVRQALNTPVPLREVADACRAGEGDVSATSDLALSAAIVMVGRSVTVSGVGCDVARGEHGDAAARLCDCLLANLQQELHVEISSEVADRDLASYEGMLTLKLWRL